MSSNTTNQNDCQCAQQRVNGGRGASSVPRPRTAALPSIKTAPGYYIRNLLPRSPYPSLSLQQQQDHQQYPGRRLEFEAVSTILDILQEAERIMDHTVDHLDLLVEKEGQNHYHG